MRNPLPTSCWSRQPYVVAMVLGTALTTLSTTQAAPAEVNDGASRTIADMSRYCTACWRNARLNPDCWNDCTQEVFSRLMERVEPQTWNRMLKQEGEERREFLRAIDTVKKRSRRAKTWAPHPVESVADRHDPHRRHVADERAAVEHQASRCLSERQQRILRLSFEGWSVHEIADELQVPPDRVSDEKYKAIRKLREQFVETRESNHPSQVAQSA